MLEMQVLRWVIDNMINKGRTNKCISQKLEVALFGGNEEKMAEMVCDVRLRKRVSVVGKHSLQ